MTKHTFLSIIKVNETWNGTHHIHCNEQDLIFAEIFSFGICGFYIAIFGGGILLGKGHLRP